MNFFEQILFFFAPFHAWAGFHCVLYGVTKRRRYCIRYLTGESSIRRGAGFDFEFFESFCVLVLSSERSTHEECTNSNSSDAKRNSRGENDSICE